MKKRTKTILGITALSAVTGAAVAISVYCYKQNKWPKVVTSETLDDFLELNSEAMLKKQEQEKKREELKQTFWRYVPLKK